MTKQVKRKVTIKVKWVNGGPSNETDMLDPSVDAVTAMVSHLFKTLAGISQITVHDGLRTEYWGPWQGGAHYLFTAVKEA